MNDLQPGRLEDDAAIEEMVRQALEEMRPSVVYTRSATDGDADRRAVHPPAMSAAWNVPDVSCFQSRTAAEYWGRFATFGLVEPLEVVRATR